MGLVASICRPNWSCSDRLQLNQDLHLHFADFRRTVAAPAGAASAAAFCSKATGHRVLGGVGAFPHPNRLRAPPPPSPR
jgi:hypothetical protein